MLPGPPFPQVVALRIVFSFHSIPASPNGCNRLSKPLSATSTFGNSCPTLFDSLTIYRSREPAAAWSSLDSAVSFKLDVAPAVFFGSLLQIESVELWDRQSEGSARGVESAGADDEAVSGS